MPSKCPQEERAFLGRHPPAHAFHPKVSSLKSFLAGVIWRTVAPLGIVSSGLSLGSLALASSKESNSQYLINWVPFFQESGFHLHLNRNWGLIALLPQVFKFEYLHAFWIPLSVQMDLEADFVLWSKRPFLDGNPSNLWWSALVLYTWWQTSQLILQNPE